MTHGKHCYYELAAKVSKINKGAARYMRKRAPKDLEVFAYSGKLMACFVWSNTPQGHGFWRDINNQLMKAYVLHSRF